MLRNFLEESDDRHGDSSTAQEGGKALPRHGSAGWTTERPDQKVRLRRLGGLASWPWPWLRPPQLRPSRRTRPQQTRPKQSGPVTALVVMTPNGPATCATWVQWRAPAAHPADKAAIEYWVEGYLSGLAAGSKHDVIGQFRRDALASLARPILHRESADETSGCSECPRARNARSSRGTTMIAMLGSIGTRRLVLIAVALALALSATGCASGPPGSHGTDYIPAFDAPYQGDG